MARFIINGIDVYVEQWNVQATKTLMLLHGFTGSTKTWHPVVELLPSDVRIIAVDLMGHGQTAAPVQVEAYSMTRQIELLEALVKQLELNTFSLLGYSMGGRVALSYAASYPKRIKQLLIESASPGLISQQARDERKQADDQLAEKIQGNGIESFVDKWENIPLFATQKQLALDVQQQIRIERLAQRAHGLANSLRGMGTGVMPQQWDNLSNLQMPVLLMTGALDLKFVQLNKQMEALLPNAKHVTIPAVGHAIHVENPIKFATIVEETIS